MKNTIEILDKFNIKYEIICDKIYLKNKYLDLSNKNLEGCLDVSKIENLDYLECLYSNLTEIICNDNLYHLNCSGNNLTKIICNDNLKYLNCSYNNLSEIICNDNLEFLFCNNNFILSLNRNDFKCLDTDIYIYDNKYYYNNKEITDISVKNNKKIMKIDNKIFIILNNYPYDISNIEYHIDNKKLFYEKYN